MPCARSSAVGLRGIHERKCNYVVKKREGTELLPSLARPVGAARRQRPLETAGAFDEGCRRFVVDGGERRDVANQLVEERRLQLKQ